MLLVATVLLAGESSCAMLASARLCCITRQHVDKSVILTLTLNWQLHGLEFDFEPPHCQVITYGKLFTPMLVQDLQTEDKCYTLVSHALHVVCVFVHKRVVLHLQQAKKVAEERDDLVQSVSTAFACFSCF